MKGLKFYNRDWDKDADQKVHKLLLRLNEMKTRRQRFEKMWRDSLYSFVAFAIYDKDNGQMSQQYDINQSPEMQSYYNNRISGGFKYSDVRYPLEFAIVTRKMATEIPNLPDLRWIVQGETDQSPAVLWKHVYNAIMYEADFDFEAFELWLGKNVFGTSISWSKLDEQTYHCKEPSVGEDGEISWKSKTTKTHEFTWESVDLRNVLIDNNCKKTSLRDADDCAVIEYLSEDKLRTLYPEFRFGNDDTEGVAPEKCFKPVSTSHTFQDIDELYGGGQKEVYELIHYYNVRTDSYQRIMNGKEFVPESGIIMRDDNGKKMLPIAFFVDHKIPGCPYGYGEPTIAKPFREIKNKVRNVIFDVTKKVAKPTIAVDPLSPFKEESYVWGQDFIRVAPRDLMPLNVNANLDPAMNLDKTTDNDIIISTGINITDTANIGGGETATKTVVRKESQVAVVELGMRFNTSVGLKRLHQINANIILLYLSNPIFDSEVKDKTVVLKNEKMFRSTSTTKIKTEPKKGEHVFTWKGEDFNYKFKPVPELGNIAVTKTLEKGMFTEGSELLFKVTPEALDKNGLAEFICQLYEIPDTVLMQKKKSILDSDPDIMAQNAGAVLPDEVKMANNNKLNINAQSYQLNQAISQPGTLLGVPSSEEMGTGAGAPSNDTTGALPAV
jgi:hypothetical protein